MNPQIENINIHSETEIVHPDRIKADYPLTSAAVETVARGQREVKAILDGDDPRLFVVVGPCSIHDVEAARDYARRLKALADEVEDTLLLVMRVYFEKPRTSIGWQGLINDPRLDGSYDIETGIRLARELLLDIAELGLPTAGEALDLVTPQYIQDLFSWTAIGARTTESQTHRKMASGFSSAVGFKNGTNGDLQVAINAILAAAHENNFLSINPQGRVAIIRTRGNRHCHIVLRGGADGPNYDEEHIARCERQLRHAGLPANIMVDCSHANAGKVAANQLRALDDIAGQIERGNRSIKAVMLESNIHAGNQAIPDDPAELAYGVSVTDPCLGWEETAEALRELRQRVRSARANPAPVAARA